MNTFNVRAAEPADAQPIKQLAIDNRMFAPDEMDEFFDDMLAGFFDGSLDGHQWLVATHDADPTAVAAAAYFAPEPFADRMWNLYFLAVDTGQHGGGAGSTIVKKLEDQLRAAGDAVARTLIVDTSSTEEYASARRFYASRGFVEEATLRDFYGPGDHKVTFWKSLVE